MLSDADRLRLLNVARTAILARLQRHRFVPEAHDGDPLLEPRAAFVTILQKHALRGCIGYLGRDLPLIEVVARSAVSAATADPRFPPLQPAEADESRIEISVLGAFEPLQDPARIEVGRHGLVVEHGQARGLLLPQVAVEWAWTPLRFLEQTCVKAGLPPHAWREGASLYLFEAEVFGEPEPSDLAR